MRNDSLSIVVFLVFTLIIFNCGPLKTESIEGLWKLKKYEVLDSIGEWKEAGNGFQGYILYDDKNNMAVHLTEVGYENTNLRFPNFTDSISIEAMKHLTKSYVYFAKYKLSKKNKTLEHNRISHSNPGQWNQNVKRTYLIKGDTLILQPINISGKITSRLIWIKMHNK